MDSLRKVSADTKNICQCLQCKTLFDFRDRVAVDGGHGTKNYKCPSCKGSFTFIKYDHRYDLFKFLYINTDPRYYNI